VLSYAGGSKEGIDTQEVREGEAEVGTTSGEFSVNRRGESYL